jgi:predicted DNA-binding transcriptional regulator AlpA
MLPSENILDDFWTKKDLATQLKTSPRTLDRWELAGNGPPKVQIGRTILYRKESVSQWLISRETTRRRPDRKRGGAR